MKRAPSTAAIRLLREHHVAFTEHVYRYEAHGGTGVPARELGLDEHTIIKTLVLQDDERQPLLMLMHGDREVSLRALARQAGRRSIEICAPEVANRHSGYLVGGTSPFGTRKSMPVYLERTVLDLDQIYVNGGSRGFLVALSPRDLARLLTPTMVDVALVA